MTCCDSPRLRLTSLRSFLTPVLGLSLMLAWPAASLAQIDQKFAVKEPVPHRVYQRGDDDQADIPIVLGEELPADAIVGVTFFAGNRSVQTGGYRDGKLLNVPTGGPYVIQIRVSRKPDKEGGFVDGSLTFGIGPVFVGDLWVLAGQSNMQGVGDLVDVTPPSERVMALGMDGKWVAAEEPLHWLVDSPDPVHSGKPDDREARSRAEHRDRTKGAGLGLPFGVALAGATNVPVGLVVCAHGGTSMAQWDPAKKEEGGNSLYGSMLRQVKLAGGKVRGVLWYQGESDASATAAPKFAETFTKFIGAVRSDFGQPELPFYYVQIGRFVFTGDPQGWNIVRDAQRLIPDRVRGTAVVASIDLELDDAIHVGTPGLKRGGGRRAHAHARSRHQACRQRPRPQVQGSQPAAESGRVPIGRPDELGRRFQLSSTGHTADRRSPARAAHCRVLDPQGRRDRDPPDLRRGRRAVERLRHPQTLGRGPPGSPSLVRLRPRSLLQPGRRPGHGGARLRADRARRLEVTFPPDLLI
jgi:sialate O-acetylesterase